MKFIIATHGYLADGYASSIKVLTNKENIYVIHAYVEEMFDVSKKINDLLDSFDQEEEVMFFTDIMSGSMTQSITKFLTNHRITCITGINLPLILEFILTTQEINYDFIETALEEARKQMICINHLIA